MVKRSLAKTSILMRVNGQDSLVPGAPLVLLSLHCRYRSRFSLLPRGEQDVCIMMLASEA